MVLRQTRAPLKYGALTSKEVKCMTYCELLEAIDNVCYGGTPVCDGCFLENVDNCRKLYDYIVELAREELDDE
jgi:hypothetical protein